MKIRRILLGAASVAAVLSAGAVTASVLQDAPRDAPWQQAGALVARFHRAGLDHADLNAHNLLFDGNGRGWMIDFDRGRMRIPATHWREANLRRLLRSLLKLRGERAAGEVEADFARLRRAYDLAWKRGC